MIQLDNWILSSELHHWDQCHWEFLFILHNYRIYPFILQKNFLLHIDKWICNDKIYRV